MQQRYGLSNSEIRVTSQESSESTDGCHPSLSHYLPRPSRWSRTYACSAVSKSHCTHARTWWQESRKAGGCATARKRQFRKGEMTKRTRRRAERGLLKTRP